MYIVMESSLARLVPSLDVQDFSRFSNYFESLVFPVSMKFVYFLPHCQYFGMARYPKRNNYKVVYFLFQYRRPPPFKNRPFLSSTAMARENLKRLKVQSPKSHTIAELGMFERSEIFSPQVSFVPVFSTNFCH
jgi:hypothetical protein